MTLQAEAAQALAGILVGQVEAPLQVLSGRLSIRSCSAYCWLKKPIFSRWFFLISPWVGVSLPVSSRSSVLFPTPLGPTMQILESMSMPKSRFLKSGFWPS